MTNTETKLRPTPSFKVSEISYPRMRLAGNGRLIPSGLATSKRFAYVSQFLSEERFPENHALGAWEDELVFFPVRRMSRVPKILEQLKLRAPTYHHATAFGFRIQESPVGGSVIFPHTAIAVPEMGECVVSYVILPKSLACACSLKVFREPVWAVGLA